MLAGDNRIDIQLVLCVYLAQTADHTINNLKKQRNED